MTNINDIVDRDELDRHLIAGDITSARHARLPLTIYCYAKAFPYKREWTDTTRLCRGLIVADDGNVVARPIPKFFNHGEPGAPCPPGMTPTVYDKLDGSLAIIANFDGALVVATKATFHSPMAEWAARWLAEHHPTWRPPPGLTVCAEIIAPMTRVVVDYGGREEVIGLTGIDNATGGDVMLEECAWPGSRVHPLEIGFEAVKAAAHGPRPSDAEGFVLCWPSASQPSLRLKVKYDEYLTLHRVLSNLSARVVFVSWATDRFRDVDAKRLAWLLREPAEQIARAQVAGGCLTDLLDVVPDEFHGWCRRLVADFEEQLDRLSVEVTNLCADLPDDRRRAAEMVLRSGLPRSACFSAYADRPWQHELLRHLDVGDDAPVPLAA